ncbi:hypothetical protein JCM19233_242 [Vibrio astriarenae]|nr:hypothetical protein JCM19233_242 [Vibrio sp. C7]
MPSIIILSVFIPLKIMSGDTIKTATSVDCLFSVWDSNLAVKWVSLLKEAL